MTRGDHVATLLPNGPRPSRVARARLARRARGAGEPRAVGTAAAVHALRSDTSTLVVAEAFVDRLDGLASPAEPTASCSSATRMLRACATPVEVVSGAFLDGVEPADDLDGPDLPRHRGRAVHVGHDRSVQARARAVGATSTSSGRGSPPTRCDAGEAVYCPLPMAHNSGRSCFNYAMAARRARSCSASGSAAPRSGTTCAATTAQAARSSGR